MALSRARAWAIAIVATLAMSISYVDRQVMAAIATSVRAALAIDGERFGWLAGAFSLSYLVAAPMAGALLDRAGARRGLVAAIAIWSCVSAAHALAPSFGVLFALRIALGAAEAPSFPGAAQSVRRALPASDRSAAFGLVFTGSSLGAAVAAPLAIKLDVLYGWQVAFVVTSALGAAWVPLWLWATSAPEARAALARPDPLSASDPPQASSRLALDPAVLRALLLVFASAPALMFVFIWLPQFLELGRGVPKAALPRMVWLPPVMADLGMVGFGALASRRDRRSAEVRSHVPLVLVAAAMESTMAIAPQVRGAWASVIVVGVAAAGGGGLYTLLTADMMARVHPARVSTAGGLTAAAQSLVYVVFNPIVGRWLDATRSFDRSMLVFGAVALPGAIAWSLVPVGNERPCHP